MPGRHTIRVCLSALLNSEDKIRVLAANSGQTSRIQLKSREKRVSSSKAPPYKSLISLAHTLADKSAKAALPYFRKQIEVDNKAKPGDFDPVTRADRAAERVIVKEIRKVFPEHGVIGEEFGIEQPDARFRWVIDPIDGTRAFITGTPMWGTLIGLLDGDSAHFGLINHPFSNERCWSAEDGTYARAGAGKARRIRTRSCARLEDAFLMTTSPDLFQKGMEADGFQRLKAQVRMTRFGGDCYSYFLLASGMVDLVVEAGLQIYDVVALIPVIEKAGGRITCWDGSPAVQGGRIVAAGDPALHALALKLLNR